MSDYTNHTIYLYRQETRSYYATITDEGHVATTGNGEVDAIDDVWLVCDECGLLAADELRDHGIDDQWEEA